MYKHYLAKGVKHMVDGITDFEKAITELAYTVVQSLANNKAVIAYAWAKEKHPEWVRILNRTKKKRIRKKYHDRIMRAFMEAMKDGRQ